ncbi:MAG: tetratricopeptide repeat protein [Aquisalinus sp.]|nr:tetratricopeptide repeat protein [Aquisalinus sp.]
MEKKPQIRFLIAGVLVLGAVAALALFITTDPQNTSSDNSEAALAPPKTINELVANFRSANPDTSPDLLTAFRDSLTNLEASETGEKKAAFQDISLGNTGAAVERLEKLARQLAEGADSSILDASATLREAGAVAYTIDPPRAITNYTSALSLTPSDPDLARELGQIHLALRDYDSAEAAFSRLLQTEGVIDRKARATALRNLGDVELNRSRYERAAAYYQRSFAEYETAEDPQGMAEALVQLAVTQQLAGNLDQAEIFHRRALALYEETGDLAGAARSLINLGQVEMTRTNIPLAEDYLRRGVAQNLEIGQEVIAARGLGNLGLIEKARGSLYAAEDLHQRALALYEKNDDKAGMARELGNLGNIENDRGNFADAEAYHRRSLALDEETGRTAGIATTLSNLGGLAQVQGDVPAACDYWQRASALFADLGSDIQYRTVLGWMSNADCGLIE